MLPMINRVSPKPTFARSDGTNQCKNLKYRLTNLNKEEFGDRMAKFSQCKSRLKKEPGRWV